MLPLLVLALPGVVLLVVLYLAYVLWGAKGHRVHVVVLRNGRLRLRLVSN